MANAKTQKPQAKKEEFITRDKRLRAHINESEFEAAVDAARSDNPIKTLTKEEFTEIVEELGELVHELRTFGIFIHGVQGKGTLRFFEPGSSPGVGPLIVADMNGNGTFTGGTLAGFSDYGDGLMRGEM